MGKIITSFDIGIINLAYCTLEYCPQSPDGNQFIIHNWNVIDLLKNTQKNKKCQFILQSGQKKGQICGHPAHYSVVDQSSYILCKIHSRPYDITQLQRFYTISNTSVFELVKLIVAELDSINFNQSEEIIIESQPSKNPRMKNLSMMLLNYFMIRYVSDKPVNDQHLKDIKFINSRNKLSVYNGPYIECHLKNQHARNKYYGQRYCQYIIRHNQERLKFFNLFKKKDDLADSFLQGVWYLLNGYTDKPAQAQTPTQAQTQTTQHKIKLKLKLKPSFVGKQLLEQIRHNDTTKMIKIDYNINKYKNLRRGTKPKIGIIKYTLSNIKYVMERKLYDPTNSFFLSSLKYYFGDSFNEIIALYI